MHQREDRIAYFETNGYLNRDVGGASQFFLKKNALVSPTIAKYLEDRLFSVSFFFRDSIFIFNSNMTWFFSPIKSTDTNSALLADIKPRFPIQPVVTVFFRESPFRESVLLSVFWSFGWSWVIIRIEIKMKSGALLPSHLPRVIDRSNLSPRRFAARW